VAALATFDHLVVAATSLAAGIDYVAERLGVVPVAGGKHVTMGTHNALLSLGPGAFLEVIAIDPAGTKPLRPRWFDLDTVAMQGELAESPRLIHWVARTNGIERAVAAFPVPLGPIHALSRGPFRWRITVADDGSRPAKGVLPTLIQWDVPAHPADTLPVSNVTLAQLAASHPEPAPIRSALAKLGLSEAIHVTFDREARLVAMLRTPRGVIAL
jgi:Glyoxalase-like domain